jgi:hypothetical protein
MSGTFPTGNVRAVNFKDNAPNLVTTSLSGRRQTKSQGQQYFSFTIQTPPLTSADLKPILGFISKQRGQFESFQIQLPNISTPAGSITSNTLAVNGAHTAGDKTIAVDGGTASASGYLKAGDMIRFIDTTTAANNVKVYMVTADLDLNGSGAGTLNIEPGLIDGVDNNSTVETNGVQFTVFLERGSQEYQMGVQGLTQMEFDVREAF